jgi:hypothetical protein
VGLKAGRGESCAEPWEDFRARERARHPPARVSVFEEKGALEM